MKKTDRDSVGGSVRWNDGYVSNPFWDTGTSGQPTSAAGTGNTTAEMKSIATFSGAGSSIIAIVISSASSPRYLEYQ